MRCLTLGLLVALILALAPPAAADGGASLGIVPGVASLAELVSYVTRWLGIGKDTEVPPAEPLPPPSPKMGPGVEPGG